MIGGDDWDDIPDEELVEDFADDDTFAALDFSIPGEGDVDGDPVADDRDDVGSLFRVTNPEGTVTVAALMNGAPHRVELSPAVTAMTERELAHEVVTVAALAHQQARAAVHAFLVEGMRHLGYDTGALSSGLSRQLSMPTPDEAAEAAARVFRARYAEPD
ncbi:hypothetical protein C731_3659 [Mycolicibacterium hassiacum DSM 44199]|jgi:hypothetical protein|uniref:Uncharacterized protein n=1 Tax=Mycolicibacterium hassiacum (strain DSM 44199 / CIP 105218 / JCM 12690 / 3849) TaxID=1122247 RepID=K5BDR6_MYCHD|nr:hypothetical protein [Mycolicibacterium hassiacum]EKF22362.1 hypothetical protein C731_3659 [Mycolicibacterium hassiacum DSM 44199]MBX5487292.1 hypothetical protein [Mycolicibacterium hassiacum]MDA4087556.1 secretion protein EspD [Mycolicibacterium hassiacum DSM 44199]VCT91812.1 ESX-1 secretion-associated protein EspH [Mycolicibacterium hassiacum DSM 44199]